MPFRLWLQLQYQYKVPQIELSKELTLSVCSHGDLQRVQWPVTLITLLSYIPITIIPYVFLARLRD